MEKSSYLVILAGLCYVVIYNELQYCLAALVVNDMIAFFQSSCPDGWSDIDNSKRGFLLVADPNGGSTAGTIVGSPLSDQENPQHGHSVAASTFCINSAINVVSALDSCFFDCSYKSLKPLPAYTICEDSPFSLADSTTNYPFVQLRLCKATSIVGQVEVPANTVAYFDSSVTSCPSGSGWSAYNAGFGRVLVPQTKDTAPQASTSSPLTSGQALSHKHSLSTTVANTLQSTNDLFSSGPQDTIGSTKDSTTRTISVQSANENSSDLGIGYIQLTACVAGPTEAPAYLPPPAGALLFTSASSCSTDGNWEAVEDAFLNRLVISLPSDANANNGATWGGSAIVPPNDVSHSHSVPATTLDMIESDWKSNSATSSGSERQWRVAIDAPTPASISIPSFTSGNNNGGSIPYLALGLCRSLGVSSALPTRAPSTSVPTKDPTKVPTHSPQKAPSQPPTSIGATKSPSKAPSTKSPTLNPTTLTTTSYPTLSPSKSTGYPTNAPSNSGSAASNGSDAIVIGSVVSIVGVVGFGAIIMICRKKSKKYVALDENVQIAINSGAQNQVPSISFQDRPPAASLEQRMRISTFNPSKINSTIRTANFQKLITIYPFKGIVDSELTVDANVELVEIGKEGFSSEWTIAMNPKNSVIGLIPTSYVKSVGTY